MPWKNIVFGIFFSFRNPTPKLTTQVPLKWKPVRTQELEYLRIENSKNITMLKNLLHERMKFWESLPHRAAVTISNGLPIIKDEL